MFKNKKFEVKVVDDKDAYAKMVEDVSKSPKTPIDRLDIELLSEKIAQDVVVTYVFVKATKTVCSVIEHIVVTRVK